MMFVHKMPPRTLVRQLLVRSPPLSLRFSPEMEVEQHPLRQGRLSSPPGHQGLERVQRAPHAISLVRL